MHRAVPNASGQADNSKVVVVPQDHHQTEVTSVVTVEYSQPWLGFRGSAGEWWP
jgi:hypothetical protein